MQLSFLSSGFNPTLALLIIMSEDVRKSWEDFLNPDVMKQRLITASIYLAAYEFLVDSITGRILEFFTDGFSNGEFTVSPKYAAEVLSKNKSPVYASLEWLQEHGVIVEDDLKSFEQVKACRNFLAHELTAVISGQSKADIASNFPVMVTLLRKIEVWWVVNVEMATNPDFDDAEVDETGIIPGPVWTLQLLLEVALGEPDKAAYYLNEFRKAGAKP